MFLRYFAELEHSAQDVVEALLTAPNEWLADVAQDSLGSGARLSADVGLNLGGHRVQRHVDVSLGSPLELTRATIIPVQWVDHSRAALFPRLEADLEIASLGPRRSQLSTNVRYEPPFGPLGAIADRALLHRVAEATVKDFVDRVAKRVHQQIVVEAR
jgi:hypothetical protein